MISPPPRMLVLFRKTVWKIPTLEGQGRQRPLPLMQLLRDLSVVEVHVAKWSAFVEMCSNNFGWDKAGLRNAPYHRLEAKLEILLWALKCTYCSSQSRSHFTADSQSVSLGVEPTLWTFDQILLPFQEFRSGICCPVSVGRPLWREAGPVLCKSQSSHFSLCTFTINISVFHTFTIYIYIHYTIQIIYARRLLVPAPYCRLCPTTRQ
jgi:hypothetical protein